MREGGKPKMRKDGNAIRWESEKAGVSEGSKMRRQGGAVRDGSGTGRTVGGDPWRQGIPVGIDRSQSLIATNSPGHLEQKKNWHPANDGELQQTTNGVNQPH